MLNQLIPKVKASGGAIVAQLERISQPVTDFYRANPIVSTAAMGAGVTGLAAATAVIVRRKKTTKRKTKRKKKKTKRGRARDRKFKSKQKHEQKYKRKRKYKVYGKKGYKYPKRKSKSKKRTGKVYYTKRGQPYKIMASGKARFIKGKRRKR